MTTPISTAASAVAEQEHVNAVFGSKPLGSFTQALLDSEATALRKQLDEAKAQIEKERISRSLTWTKIIAAHEKVRDEAISERDAALARLAAVEAEGKRNALSLFSMTEAYSAAHIALSDAGVGDGGKDVSHRIGLLRAKVTKLEAEAGAMRTALEDSGPCECDTEVGYICDRCNKWKLALATDAGSSLLARLQAAEADTKRLEHIKSGCLTLQCCEDHGYDDADVHWEVIEYHMAEPKERMIGYGRTPQEAIDAAMSPQPEEGR
jgi:hypothetical protein